MTRTALWIAAAALAITAAPALAADSVQTLIGAVRPAEGGGSIVVEIVYLNPGTTPLPFTAPAHVTAGLAVGGDHSSIDLALEAEGTETVIAAGGFERVTYRATLSNAGKGQATLSLASGASFTVPLPVGAPPTATLATADARSAPASATPRVFPGSPTGDTGNAFLPSLSAYQPMYAVYGPGTNTDAKIQISFKYQLFGNGGPIGPGRALLNGLYFAYTQRLYWDLGAVSSPFRNIDYNPELVYIIPAPVKTSGVAFGGKFGIAHESNGRDGDASRSANSVYVQPFASVPLGRYKLSVGPRLWAYVGDLSDNPDIRHFRGNTGLFLEVGEDDGLRITTNSRLNFGSGKGAIDVMASYPLTKLNDVLNLYVFGQAFTGYGENLLDYNTHQTRLRFGLGFVR